MNFGRVVGTIVSTSKDPNLEGLKLLVVQHVNMDMKDTNTFTVAADGVGAGIGEYVLVVTGSSARLGTNLKNRPIDAGVLAIVDAVEVEGDIIYRKEEEAAAR
ncbi:MAG TPA: EutN/CcmL family microcompartment protein [Candidatus Sumerlaeota bacterium]|nr:EutN/CcmL family microcompartment protein [Candidatus Sumerlaeota bacterium]HNM46264.1 EutN/CcmL family microcompartment protein [Candidatus Sumerlaeota bacterium]